MTLVIGHSVSSSHRGRVNSTLVSSHVVFASLLLSSANKVFAHLDERRQCPDSLYEIMQSFEAPKLKHWSNCIVEGEALLSKCEGFRRQGFMSISHSTRTFSSCSFARWCVVSQVIIQYYHNQTKTRFFDSKSIMSERRHLKNSSCKSVRPK